MTDETILIRAAQARFAAMTPAEKAARSAELNGHTVAPARPSHVRTVPAKPAKKPKATPQRNGLPGLSGLLIDAARTLPAEFTFRQLCVVAWHNHPERFGFEFGWQSYPDTHIVAGVLYGVRGPIKAGAMVRVRPGVFRLAVRKEV